MNAHCSRHSKLIPAICADSSWPIRRGGVRASANPRDGREISQRFLCRHWHMRGEFRVHELDTAAVWSVNRRPATGLTHGGGVSGAHGMPPHLGTNSRNKKASNREGPPRSAGGRFQGKVTAESGRCRLADTICRRQTRPVVFRAPQGRGNGGEKHAFGEKRPRNLWETGLAYVESSRKFGGTIQEKR
jgi:hypothetical protein